MSNKTNQIRIPQTIAQKDTIENFLNTTKKYRVFLKELEEKIIHVTIYNELLQKDYNNITDNVISNACHLEQQMPPIMRKKIMESFRKIIGKYICRSQLLKRFYKKPQGYPGDYVMFEMLYANYPVSQGLGYYIDKHIFNRRLTKAAIGRKEKMKHLLVDTILKSQQPIDILNIGCGSAREIKELFTENTFNHQIKLTLLDQDADALSFARAQICPPLHNVIIDFQQKNILDIIGFSKSNHAIRKESKDIIYGLGVVDYFLDNVLERFIFYCYDLLKPNGKLIFASCGPRGSNDYVFLRWFCDWNFVIRDVNRLKKFITDKMGINSVEICWEKHQQIFLVIITKEA